MFGSRTLLSATAIVAFVAIIAGSTHAGQGSPNEGKVGYPSRYDFGMSPSQEDLARFFAISPDGRGLPQGSGTYSQGKALYVQRCAACHGAKLEGWSKGMMMPPEYAAMGDGRLVGGRGSLNTPTPTFTVESYWPYATTLWDYIKRAMPQQAPGSLSNDEVYALVAYVLAEAKIVPKTAVMNADSVPQVAMPNRDGFVPDPRPELELFEPEPPSKDSGKVERKPAMMPQKMP